MADGRHFENRSIAIVLGLVVRSSRLFPLHCGAGCERETDVAIMLDSSASIGMSKFATLKMVAVSIISLLSVETGVVRVAVVTYTLGAHTHLHLDR